MDSQERLIARRTAVACLCFALAVGSGAAPAQSGNLQGAQTQSTPPVPKSPDVTITLDEAIHRAQRNEPNYAAAQGNAKIVALDKGIARSAMLPNVIYNNNFLYTEGTGLFSSSPNGDPVHIGAPIFIANNAIHEYVSQASVTETLGAQQVEAYRKAGFAAAQAAAEQEIARRGLVATVVGYYYNLLSADEKGRVMERALDEAQHFDDLTGELEKGREVAHADKVKADLQLQQRQRDLSDAKLAAEKARLDFAVLLFPDPRTGFKLADEDTQPTPPSRSDVEAAAARNNPDLKAALSALHASDAGVKAARAGYFPDLSLNYSYGIDAGQFAMRGPDNVNNLGYSTSVTFDIPVWDWFATHDRVKQAQIQEHIAQVQLTNTQRRLVADLDELYHEAAVAHDQLNSLAVSVNTARDSLRLTNLRYRAGEATSLEVVDAQNQVTLAESARADGIVRYRLALANLQTLTGTL